MECDGCTLCCKLLPVPWMNSPAYEYCKECEPDKGCKIYENVPKKCLGFECAYNQIKCAPIELRPDKCGIVFERIFEIFIGTLDLNTNVSDVAKGQIDSFVNQGFPVVLFRGNLITPLIFPTKEMTSKQTWSLIQRERKRRYGSSSI